MRLFRQLDLVSGARLECKKKQQGKKEEILFFKRKGFHFANLEIVSGWALPKLPIIIVVVVNGNNNSSS